MSLREIIQKEKIMILPCAYDVVTARIVEQEGYPVCWITGLGHEASDLGYPDIGLMNSVEIVRKAANIAQVVDVPVVCDADTGFGGVNNLVRTVKLFEAAGVSGIHIEDQTFPKRCGFLAGKGVIPAEAFVKKLHAAVSARRSKEFVIIARTDAKMLGVDEVIRRLNLYVENGADVGMVGDLYTFDEFKRIAREVKAPVVACAADDDHFVSQPNLNAAEWEKTGVKIVIYWHLMLFSALKAAERAVQTLKTTGTTESLKNDILRYKEFDKLVKLDHWLAIEKKYGG